MLERLWTCVVELESVARASNGDPLESAYTRCLAPNVDDEHELFPLIRAVFDDFEGHPEWPDEEGDNPNDRWRLVAVTDACRYSDYLDESAVEDRLNSMAIWALKLGEPQFMDLFIAPWDSEE